MKSYCVKQRKMTTCVPGSEEYVVTRNGRAALKCSSVENGVARTKWFKKVYFGLPPIFYAYLLFFKPFSNGSEKRGQNGLKWFILIYPILPFVSIYPILSFYPNFSHFWHLVSFSLRLSHFAFYD